MPLRRRPLLSLESRDESPQRDTLSEDLLRSKERVVVFCSPDGELRECSVIASSQRHAIDRARILYDVPASWEARR